MMPLVTIGITAYNAQGTIARAIRSAIAQDWPTREIIIIDDCSTDMTWDAIQQAIMDVPYARAYHNEINLGPAGSRNEILKRANGAYIAFFDDDDESLPARVRVQYERLASHPYALSACYASGMRAYPNGYRKTLDAIGSHDPIPQGPGMAARILYFGGPKDWFVGSGTPSCSLMAAKSVFDAIGGFDAGMRRCEDMDFAVRLALAGGHFIGCPEKLFIQYATEGSDKSFEKNRDAEIYLARKHEAFLRGNGMEFYARQWPRVRYYHFMREYGRMLGALAPLVARHPLKTLTHLLETGPARLKHEQKMRAA